MDSDATTTTDTSVGSSVSGRKRDILRMRDKAEVRQTRCGDSDLSPAVDSGDRRLDQLSDSTRAAQCIDDLFSETSHATLYAIIGSSSQDQSCDIRDCDYRNASFNGVMESKPALRPEAAAIFDRLDRLGLKQRALADTLGIEENKISKARKGERQFKASEVLRAQAWLADQEGGQSTGEITDPTVEYVEVEVLPTYAGMGGGGSGDGDREVALIPRALIVDLLRGSPSDFLLINVRGDSMEPDFRHGDQILVDKRDTSPAQPGPFALWDGDWGEYVVKNVERSRAGEVRIFSTNPKYQAEAAEAETTRIIGRPVWFGRRL